MKNPLFVYPGNAVILKDFERDRYVAIAFAWRKRNEVFFSTISEEVSDAKPLEFVLLYLVESLELGLQKVNRELTTPVAYRNANCAIITGDGEHYGVCVSDGSFQYALPEGKVTDEELTRGLMAKMRCPDRR